MNLNKPVSKKVLFVLPVLTFITVFILALRTSSDPNDGGGLGYVFALIAASFATFVVSILVAVMVALMSKSD